MQQKIKITVPENLNEISLGQYQEFVKKTEGLKEEDQTNLIVSIFCGIPLVAVERMIYTDTLEIAEQISGLFNSRSQFIQRFHIKNTEFGFIPSLDEMTAGEYMTVEKCFTDINTVHEAMAVLYRPVTEKKGKKYSITEYKGNKDEKELMKYVPLNVYLGVQAFFLTLGQELSKATLKSLQKELLEI